MSTNQEYKVQKIILVKLILLTMDIQCWKIQNFRKKRQTNGIRYISRAYKIMPYTQVSNLDFDDIKTNLSKSIFESAVRFY